jgi:hypothetical protein
LEDTLDYPLVELGLIRATADRQAFHFNRDAHRSLPDRSRAEREHRRDEHPRVTGAGLSLV